MLKHGNRLQQLFFGEVRPQNVCKIKLGISALPEQKVGNTDLAAGADHQVRVWDAGGIEVGRDVLLRDRTQIHPLRCAGANRVNDLVPTAIVQADIALTGLKFRRSLLGLMAQRAQFRTDRCQVAKEFQADAVFPGIPDDLIQVLFQQAHDRVHFFFRPPPVLR